MKPSALESRECMMCLLFLAAKCWPVKWMSLWSSCWLIRPSLFASNLFNTHRLNSSRVITRFPSLDMPQLFMAIDRYVSASDSYYQLLFDIDDRLLWISTRAYFPHIYTATAYYSLPLLVIAFSFFSACLLETSANHIQWACN